MSIQYKQESNTLSSRDIVLDIMRGIAIILMVIGHAGVNTNIYLFIYLFHMPVFFMLSGYLYNIRYSESWQSVVLFIKKQIKGVYLPALLGYIIYLLLYNLFYKIGFYTSNPEFLYLSGSRYGGLRFLYDIKDIFIYALKSIVLIGSNTQFSDPLWFFKNLFIVSIIFSVVSFLLNKLIGHKKTIVISILSIISLFIGWGCSLFNVELFGMSSIFVSYFLFTLGYYIKLFKERIDKNKSSTVVHILYVLVAIGILIALMKYGQVSIARNEFINPLFIFLASISGWILLYSLSYIIKDNVVGDYIAIVGKKTRIIVLLHMLSFKLVSFLIIKVNRLPQYALASFPVIEGENWWILYSLVGILLPVFIGNGIKKIFVMKGE